MKTYLETDRQLIPGNDVMVFKLIKHAVDCLPSNLYLGRDDCQRTIVLSCHILARAVARVYGLKVVDGFYLLPMMHSWLVTPSGNVIDVYPVATIGGPILVHCNPRIDTPGRKLYLPQSARKMSRACGFGKPHFRRAITTVVRELRKASLRA